jgi:hypothetical protein
MRWKARFCGGAGLSASFKIGFSASGIKLPVLSNYRTHFVENLAGLAEARLQPNLHVLRLGRINWNHVL